MEAQASGSYSAAADHSNSDMEAQASSSYPLVDMARFKVTLSLIFGLRILSPKISDEVTLNLDKVTLKSVLKVLKFSGDTQFMAFRAHVTNVNGKYPVFLECRENFAHVYAFDTRRSIWRLGTRLRGYFAKG